MDCCSNQRFTISFLDGHIYCVPEKRTSAFASVNSDDKLVPALLGAYNRGVCHRAISSLEKQHIKI